MKAGDVVRYVPEDSKTVRAGQRAVFLNAQGAGLIQIRFELDGVHQIITRKEARLVLENSSTELARALRLIERVIESNGVRSLPDLLSAIDSQRTAAVERERQHFIETAQNCGNLIKAQWYQKEQKLNVKKKAPRVKREVSEATRAMKKAEAIKVLTMLGVNLEEI